MMKSTRSYFQVVVLVFAASLLTGCATIGKTLKAWMNGRDVENAPKTVNTPKFSDQDNLRAGQGTDRQYKRMNRQRLEEEAELKADAGSLWVMEGQGAYLFSQNQMRMVGDLLNVKIEGAPKSQLQTKVRVISKLLDRLDNPSRGLASVARANAAAAGGQANAQAANPTGVPTPPNPGGAAPDGQAGAPAAGQPGVPVAEGGDKNDLPFAVASVPTRIVEQLKDGSYRVRGMQPFMIGKREYKVIVTGIVRSEDFDDAGLDAGKLLDPQFDIVSSRRGASL